MSHSIKLYIFKESSIKDLNFFKGVPHVIENGYILAPLDEKMSNQLSLDYMNDDNVEEKLLNICTDFVWAETDYFGGMGDQDAKAWVDGKYKVLDVGSINCALKAIGVVRSEKEDEFETINLGMYRSNESVIHKWEDFTGKTTEKMIRRLLLRQIPIEMKLVCNEVRVYTSKNRYVCMTSVGEGPKHYHSCVIDSSEILPMNVLKFKETRTRTDRETYDAAILIAVSQVRIDYVNDTIYKFIKYTSIPINNKEVTTMCAVEYECDEQGDAYLHKQIFQISMHHDALFNMGPFELGITGRDEVKKELVKKNIDVFACPVCDTGLIVGTFPCNECGCKQ